MEEQRQDTHGNIGAEMGILNLNPTLTTSNDPTTSDQQSFGPDSISQQESQQAPGQTGTLDEPFRPTPSALPNDGIHTGIARINHLMQITDNKFAELIAKDKITFPVQDSNTLHGEVTYSWLKDLSNRMNSVEDNVNKAKYETNKARPEAAEALDTYMLQTIPQVRDCNWEQFKNRFPDENGIFAIEILLSSRNLDEEIEQEQLKRLKPRKGRLKSSGLVKKRRVIITKIPILGVWNGCVSIQPLC